MADSPIDSFSPNLLINEIIKKVGTHVRFFIYSTPGGALTAAREATVRRTRVNVIER